MFRVSAPGRVLFVGHICLDVVNEVPSYPKEDSYCRSLSTRRVRGGNAANSAVVLSDLFGGDLGVSWMGVIPHGNDPDAAFVLADLEAQGVDTSLHEVVVERTEGDGTPGLPTAWITASRSTGSRTIVSMRQGMRELSAQHFVAMLRAERLQDVEWCHLECREMPTYLDMARAWSSWDGAGFLSCEVEKTTFTLEVVLPLLSLCSVVFLSREFCEHNGQHAQDGGEHFAVRCLRAFSARAAVKALWVCGWGCDGSFALESDGTAHYEPVHVQRCVVDSIGAGDTFVAAMLYALVNGARTAQALRCANSVAGRKVAQVGFKNLRDAVPQDMPWLSQVTCDVGDRAFTGVHADSDSFCSVCVKR